MPQEYIKESVFRTASPVSTCSPVIGHTPPLASVAAMTLADSHVISIEHNCNEVKRQSKTDMIEQEKSFQAEFYLEVEI